LRYDNRWLRIYWDGKLKEVEKDYNFYVSTPIKNKLFTKSSIQTNNINLLNYKLQTNTNNGLSTYNDNIDFNNYFTKKIKKKVEDGEFRNSFYINDLNNYYYNSKLKYTLDDNFLDYRFGKNYYSKNIKNPIKTTEEINSESNLWSLNKINSISRIYPNLNKTLLAGNLLIGSKESEGSFNTNLVSIRNPT